MNGDMGCITVWGASVERAGGLSGQLVLEAEPDDLFVVVHLTGAAGKFTLLLDPEWIDLALETRALDPTLLEGVAVPDSAIVMQAPGWL